MEIKINKEIRQYQESIFFGLNLRQFICAVLAVGVAVAVYFGLQEPLGEETVSWVCILAASPLAGMGFFKYNDMPLEQFVWAWFKTEFLLSGRRTFQATNIYTEAMKNKEDYNID